MDLKYLKHLAKRGAGFIHPKGKAATGLLMEKLKIEPGLNILEVGCGTGATLAEISLAYNVDVNGMDVLDEMISIARERMKYCKIDSMVSIFKSEILKPFPFEPDSFDRIYCESVLGFQPKENFDFMISEISRILKPGGLFICNEALWLENTPDELVKEAACVSLSLFGLGNASENKIDLNCFIGTAKQKGLDSEEIINLDSMSFSADRDAYSISSQFTQQVKRKKQFSLPFILKEISFNLKQKKVAGYSRYIDSYILIFKK